MAYATAKTVDVSIIPVIDLSGLREGDPAALDRVAREIGEAARTIGFFYVRNHGIPEDLIEAVYETAGRFFHLPDEEKAKVRVSPNHRGFLAAGGAKMQDDAKPDLKESFIWGLDVGADDPDVRAGRPLIGPNRWSDAVPDMQATFSRYFDEANRLGWALFRVFAHALGKPSDHFVRTISKPMTRCSVIWYPPQPEEMGEDQFGVGPHTDFGALTLLRQDEVGGLQVQDKAGDWVTAHPIPGTIVVNVGDLMARWTNDRFASTPHRVVNSSGRERISIVAAVDPDFDTDMSPVVGEGETPRYEPITCGDYLVWRFGKAFGYRKKD